MQLYRVYFLDDAGQVLNQEDMDCRDDDDAIDRAGRSDHPFAMELKAGTRAVARFDAIGARRVWRLGC